MTRFDILQINPDLVCSIIVESREFHAKEGVTISEEAPQTEYEYDWAQVLADHQDDMTYLEITSVINSLSEGEKTDLLALMLLGRGDYDDWNEAYAEALENLPLNLTDYLLGHPYLSDYLEEALSHLGYSCDARQEP